MNGLTKLLLACVAAGGLLSGCATYDYGSGYGYGYGYTQPYYGYGYDYGPYSYDNAPYYGFYGPAYYASPSIGFDFRSGNDRRDRGNRHRTGRSDSRFRAQHRGGGPYSVQANRPQHNRASVGRSPSAGSRTRVPAAPAAQRAQLAHSGARAAQTARNEQQ